MRKFKKSLSRENYTQLFRILGKSKRPLSSYELEQEMVKAGMKQSESPYVYVMLEEIFPKSVEQKINLCRWDKVPGDKREEEKLIKGLNENFKLGWIINNKEQRSALKIKKIDKMLIIENDYSNTRIEIEQEVHNEQQSTRAKITIYTNDNETLSNFAYLVEDNNLFILQDPGKLNPPIKFLDYYYKHRPYYLSRTLDEQSRKLISQKEELCKKLRNSYIGDRGYPRLIPIVSPPEEKIKNEITKIYNNKRKWRFYLNVRGLIQYLLGEIELQKREEKIHNNRISKVLQNLSDLYPEEFPFLLYYHDFAIAFEKLRPFAEIPKNYEVELLKKIADELKYQVQYADDDFLRYWVTRRYSGEITYYFASAWRFRLLDVDKDNLNLPFRKMMSYQKTNLNVMAEYLKYELENITGMYEELIDTDKKMGFNLYTYF